MNWDLQCIEPKSPLECEWSYWLKTKAVQFSTLWMEHIWGRAAHITNENTTDVETLKKGCSHILHTCSEAYGCPHTHYLSHLSQTLPICVCIYFPALIFTLISTLWRKLVKKKPSVQKQTKKPSTFFKKMASSAILLTILSLHTSPLRISDDSAYNGPYRPIQALRSFSFIP